MPEGEIEILLVEDSPADVELTLYALRRHCVANRIHVARDGEEALNFVFCRGEYGKRSIAEAPRLILLDLKLPKVDGHEVLKAIKEDPRTRAIPVVILTSSKEEKDLCASYELGVNSYVQKPVDFEEFRQTVTKLGLYWLLVNEPPSRPGVEREAAG
ncbi:MAG TPA: response regulator [Terriglobia bacterium]|nr:response regulator [Terriglobia bacterium]